MTLSADLQEMSCSVEMPPKMIATFFMMALALPYCAT